MRMKRYQAASMADAVAAIRAELGPRAVILHASESKRGPFGILGKPVVEVVAAVDDTAPARQASSPARAAARPPGRTAHGAAAPPAGGDAGTAGGTEPPVDAGGLGDMRRHVIELRRALGELTRHSQWPGMAKLAPPLVELYQRLVDQEVEPSLAQELVATVDGELSLRASGDRATVLDCLAKHLRRMMPTAGALTAVEGEPTIVFLIGPTGVGKTTTIAKLAASLRVERHRVALITCDTYRIAAIAQLRTYADILRVPAEVVYTPDELTARVIDYLESDFIIVDTPGRSQRNADQLADLRRFVQAVPARRTLLTVTAGARYRDTLDVVARFGAIPFDGLLVTKLDETTTYGPILNLLHRTSKPLTYLTDGQNVPRDIAVATSEALAEMLVRAAYATTPAEPQPAPPRPGSAPPPPRGSRPGTQPQAGWDTRYPSEGPGTRPKDGWGYPAPDTGVPLGTTA
ncbi:MAG TPA: flagellar biosynthesis protein FlhF [Chloroflexota bacterium]|nr:flagellar biosynthesis protein FlhF [Chloroflexota bacterium]